MQMIAPARLGRIVSAILLAAGASEQNAACVSESLVSANLSGHDSHGVQKLPSYVRDIRRGSLKPDAHPRIISETQTTAVVDGMSTFGHVGASFSAETAIEKARQLGISAVSTTHCHHTGRLGRWVEKIADAGFIGMMTGAEARPPYKVAPFGGKQGALATNPVAWAVPRGEGQPPVLLDYATSVVSIGKLQVAQERGDDLPSGLILDSAGAPTDRVQEFFEGGLLLPFGGYKGYALAVIAELLAVGLSGGDRLPSGQRASCLFTIAFNPALFRSPDEFETFVGSTAARLKQTERADDRTEVLVPGEPESRSRRERAHAIPVADSTWQALVKLGRELDLDPTSFAPEG